MVGNKSTRVLPQGLNVLLYPARQMRRPNYEAVAALGGMLRPAELTGPARALASAGAWARSRPKESAVVIVGIHPFGMDDVSQLGLGMQHITAHPNLYLVLVVTMVPETASPATGPALGALTKLQRERERVTAIVDPSRLAAEIATSDKLRRWLAGRGFSQP